MRVDRGKRSSRRVTIGIFAFGVLLLGIILLLLRFAIVTDYLYHGLVKDPARAIPEGRVIVSPADGTVLYVTKVSDGIIPQVVKAGVPVPIAQHLKTEPLRPFRDGYLIGIYMNTQGVHVNRVPNNGVVKKQIIFNGPHMNMTEAEREIILTQLIPGLVSIKKAIGIPPFDLEEKGEYILKSARETLVLEEDRGAYLYIVRIADYYVGRILTWVEEGQRVDRGQKLGMIVWGSQTDIFIEAAPDMSVIAEVGDYVYGGQTILATY